MKTNEKQNVDLLGNKWVLAPGGRGRLDTCQRRLWNYQNELKSYSTLFQNLGNCEIPGEDLYGFGLALERLSKRLEKISECLSKLTEREE